MLLRMPGIPVRMPTTIPPILVAEPALHRSLSQQVISHSSPEMPFTALHTGFFSLSQQSLVEQDLA